MRGYVYDLGDIVGWGGEGTEGWSTGQIIAIQDVTPPGQRDKDATYTVRADDGALTTLTDGEVEVFLDWEPLYDCPACNGSGLPELSAVPCDACGGTGVPA
jgi:DnaJ-class molecular chaperone